MFPRSDACLCGGLLQAVRAPNVNMWCVFRPGQYFDGPAGETGGINPQMMEMMQKMGPMMEACTEMMQAKTDQMQAPEAEPQDG